MKKLISFLFLCFLVQTLFAQLALQGVDTENIVVDQKIMMPMRDGIRLCTDIYRPKTKEKVPVILSRHRITSIPGEMVKNQSEIMRPLKVISKKDMHMLFKMKEAVIFQKEIGIFLVHL